MTLNNYRSKLIWLIVLCISIGGLTVFFLNHYLSLYDDAYIYFRYVRNILSGYGVVYNPGGHPVEGFSSPLYLAVLSFTTWLYGDVVLVSQVIGFFSILGTQIITLLMVHRLTAGEKYSNIWWWGAGLLFTALVIGFDHFFLLNSVSGLETALAALIVSYSVLAILERRAVLASVMVSLCVLVRPEAVLLIPVILFGNFAGPVWIRFLPAFVLSGELIVRWVIFSDVLPNTYWAKSGGGWIHFQLGLRYLVQIFNDFPLIAMSPFILFWSKRREFISNASLIILVAVIWFGFFLKTGGDVFEYSRLAFPLVPPLMAFGIAAVFNGIYNLRGRLLNWKFSSLAVICLVLLVIGAGVQVKRHWFVTMHGFPKVERWVLTGKFLKEYHQDEIVAVVPIGAIGYYSELPIIDLVGLVTPEVAKSHNSIPVSRMNRKWIGHERYNPSWVLAQKPDLIVTTKWRPQPWKSLEQTKAGFYADWLLLKEIKAGRAPYQLYNAEIAPGLHWLMFKRIY